MTKFYIADPVHINKKNFGNLYDFFEDTKSNFFMNEDRTHWMGAFGEYSEFSELLSSEVELLSGMNDDELFDFTALEVNVFKSARAEILSLLIKHPLLIDRKLPSNIEELFSLLLDVDRQIVVLNMAAAVQWIKFWSASIKSQNPKFVLVFSGSLIYARTLIEVLKNSAPRCFVLESFFTGTDNYIEEKYEPIANNSNLKYLAYYKKLGSNEGAEERDRSRNKAINKIIQSANKNVTQPAENNAPLFANSNETILIGGQVLNDFSLLENRGVGINSLVFYKELIRELLQQTNLNVIFKAHPWERHKTNLLNSVTLDALRDFLASLEDASSFDGRLLLLENYNIKSLFKQTTYVAGINSQSLIEAAFEGFQPIQFGDAFYGQKGFTSDYQIADVASFVQDINARKVPSRLGIEGYRSYETFITKALQFSLVSAFPSGKAILRSTFTPPPHVAIAKAGGKAATPAARLAQQASTPAVAKLPTEAASVAEPKAEKLKPPISKAKKKWIKFFKTPRKFFLDSKDKNVRWLYIFFPSFLFK